MKTVTHAIRENRLARLLVKPGGITAEAAVSAARKNVAEVQGEVAEEVDRRLALLQQACEQAEDQVAARREAYGHANVVVGLAGACGQAELGRAAFSLCDLADKLIEADRWDAEAVGIHLSAMTLLRSDRAAPPELRVAILEGLADLVRKATA